MVRVRCELERGRQIQAPTGSERKGWEQENMEALEKDMRSPKGSAWFCRMVTSLPEALHPGPWPSAHHSWVCSGYLS